LDVLEGQYEIIETKLGASYKFNYLDFHLDFGNFKSLEVLNVCEFQHNELDLPSVEKLPNLKKLKMMRLMPIKSSSRQELHFLFDSPEDSKLVQIAVNCPNLRVLGTFMVRIDFIFLHFPKLEGLRL
jgi:hypothetical protein